MKKSIVYYYYYDGDLYYVDWCIVDVCVNWYFCVSIIGNIVNYIGVGCWGGNFWCGYYVG